MKGRNMLCEYTSPTSVLVLFTHNICTTSMHGGIVEVGVCVCVCTDVAIWRQGLMLRECVCCSLMNRADRYHSCSSLAFK